MIAYLRFEASESLKKKYFVENGKIFYPIEHMILLNSEQLSPDERSLLYSCNPKIKDIWYIDFPNIVISCVDSSITLMQQTEQYLFDAIPTVEEWIAKASVIVQNNTRIVNDAQKIHEEKLANIAIKRNRYQDMLAEYKNKMENKVLTYGLRLETSELQTLLALEKELDIPDYKSVAQYVKDKKRQIDQQKYDNMKYVFITAHGSPQLRLAYELDYECNIMYVTERAHKEFPDYKVYFENVHTHKSECPSVKAINFLIENGSFGKTIAVLENTDEEVIMIKNYLGNYTLIKKL